MKQPRGSSVKCIGFQMLQNKQNGLHSVIHKASINESVQAFLTF